MPFDAFAQLRLPRRPYLAEETVRDAFHRLAAEHHPDKTGGESDQFSELTTAFETLRKPELRLKHLIELEVLQMPEPLQAALPPDLADLFPEVAQIRQRIAAALEKKRSAANALARSLAAVEVAETFRSAKDLSVKLEDLHSTATVELRQIDASWPDPNAQAALLSLHARFAFLTKWRDQLRESLLQLQLS